MADYGIMLPRHADGRPVYGKLLWAALRAMSHAWDQKSGKTLGNRNAATEAAGQKVVDSSGNNLDGMGKAR